MTPFVRVQFNGTLLRWDPPTVDVRLTVRQAQLLSEQLRLALEHRADELVRELAIGAGVAHWACTRCSEAEQRDVTDPVLHAVDAVCPRA